MAAVAFILYNLPAHFGDDFSEDLENDMFAQIENMSGEIASAYLKALQTILGSALNQAGMVQAVYVNIFDKGCFQLLNPQANLYQNVTPARFEAMLRELFSTRQIVDPLTSEVSWREIQVANILGNLPANKHLIGCVSGAASQSFTNYRNYVTVAPDNRTFVLTVGGFEGGELQASIQDYVKVSDFPLTSDTILSRMCIAFEKKWNMA